MIQQFFDGMITLMLAKFILNDVPHAAGFVPHKEIPIKYDPLFAERGEKGSVRIDPETFTPVEIRLATGLTPQEERRVLAHEKLEWREAERAKRSGMTFGEYVEKRARGEKGPAHKWIPLD